MAIEEVIIEAKRKYFVRATYADAIKELIAPNVAHEIPINAL